MSWFSRNIPKEKPLGLGSEDNNEVVENTAEQAQEVQEKPRSMEEIKAIGEQRIENARNAVVGLKSGITSNIRSLWGKLALLRQRVKMRLWRLVRM